MAGAAVKDVHLTNQDVASAIHDGTGRHVGPAREPRQRIAPRARARQ